MNQPDLWHQVPTGSPYPLFFSGGRADNDVMLTVDVGEDVEWIVYNGLSGALQAYGTNRLKDVKAWFRGITPDADIRGTLRGKAAVGWLLPQGAVERWKKDMTVPF